MYFICSSVRDAVNFMKRGFLRMLQLKILDGPYNLLSYGLLPFPKGCPSYFQQWSTESSGAGVFLNYEF